FQAENEEQTPPGRHLESPPIISYAPKDQDQVGQIDECINQVASSKSYDGGAGFGFGRRDLDYHYESLPQAEAGKGRVEAKEGELEALGAGELEVTVCKQLADKDG